MKSDQLNDKFTLILCFEELLWFFKTKHSTSVSHR